MEDENKNQNVDTQTTAVNSIQTQDDTKKTENKSEGEKTKKSVAQKGADGSIVFKNQDELDGFIARMYAKGAKEAGNGNTQNQDQVQNNGNQTAENETNKDTVTNSAEGTVPSDYLSTKIALAMAKAGINAEKVERAARLVDINKVLENGQIDEKKLKDEIDSVVSEFPELKTTKEEQKEEKGFKFGATQSSDTNQKTKKSIPTKRWNRFNSF
jgi:Tfp pilus tip-associated adhesin PilY1